jgi:tetratricopeptide (TPR) repeat protein
MVRLIELEAALRAAPGSLRLGSEYRLLVIDLKAYERSGPFLEELARANPHLSNAWVNAALARIDRIPDAGTLSQLKLGQAAAEHLTRALEIEPTFLGYYVRGLVALYYPEMFNAARRGIADLERALELASREDRRDYHAMAWVSLGDGHWKLKDRRRAREIWAEGLARFPLDADLAARRAGTARRAIGMVVRRTYDPAVRMDTSLRQLWAPAG